MSLTIESRPIKTIESLPAPFVAAKNPVVYTFQRKDQVFAQINNSSGEIQIQVNGTLISSNFKAGDKVYVRSDNGLYDMIVTVVIATTSSGNTLIFCEEAYLGAATGGGFINYLTFRPDYSVDVNVYRDSDDVLLGTLNITPFWNGKLNADIGSIVNSNLFMQNSVDLSAAEGCYPDTDVILSIYITTLEVWTSSANSPVSDSANVVQAVKAANQIGYTYGSNLFEYSVMEEYKFLNKCSVLYRDKPNIVSFIKSSAEDLVLRVNSYSGANTLLNSQDLPVTGPIGFYNQLIKTFEANAERLTLQMFFENDVLGTLDSPSAWSEFETAWDSKTADSWIVTISNLGSDYFSYMPFTPPVDPIIFYISLTVTGTFTMSNGDGIGFQVYYGEIDPQGLTGTSDIELLDGNPADIYIDEPSSVIAVKPSGAGATFKLKITLTNTGGTDAIFLRNAGGLVNTGSGLMTIKLDNDRNYFSEEPVFEPITEEKEFTIQKPCPEPAIQLMWRNLLGGIEQYVFPYSHIIGHVIRQNEKFRRILLSAEEVTTEQWYALTELFTSGAVIKENIIELSSSIFRSHRKDEQQVYIINSDNTKLGVIVNEVENEIEAKSPVHSFSCEIELPQIYE